MATVYPDSAGLPPEMLVTVMQTLEIPDVFRAGTVCTTWYAAYARADNDAGTATLYSPASDVAFKVHLPEPPLRTRALVGSAHGWLATATRRPTSTSSTR
ncbi:hypothetical protein PR202_ga22035 [Eleusine coracana subsp. coracana]|uniref:F-box domain-containing protein n=1 Tax=Eleusine coracana subsp. coracana TaxID=191504 RepID=A0AAV5D2M3_ELECO|nr:hypothetical protein PR202_ga22035 [Eleusine coracana subsp. coracana]